MDTSSKKIELKVYIEGIELPLNSIQLQEAMNGFPQCSINFPLDRTILELEPRSLVHVFYKDVFTKDWILIFEGETSGITLNKNEASRTVMVNCISIFSHWLQAKKYGTALGNLIGKNVYAKKGEAISSSIKDMTVPEDSKETKSIYDQMNANLKKYGVESSNIEFIDKLATEEQEKNSDESNLAINQMTTISDENNLKQFTDLASLVYRGLDGKYTSEAIYNAIKIITNNLANSNSGYTNFHNTLRFNQRIKVFGNKSLEYIIKAQSAENFLREHFEQITDESSLFTIIMQLGNILNYNFLLLSAPTIFKNFDNEASPMSAIFLPTAESFLPPSCNIIFKDEVSSLGYSRDQLAEPTRIFSRRAATMSPGGLIDRDIFNFAINFMVAPTTNIRYVNKESGKEEFQLSKKERLRGVSAKRIDLDYSALTAKYYADAIKANKKEEDDSAVYQGDYDFAKSNNDLSREHQRSFLDFQYFYYSRKSRSFNLETTYSPYRVCGLPGIFLEDESFPSILGTIDSISTVISADGASKSTIIFKSPTLINGNSFDIATNLDNAFRELGWNEEQINNKEARWPFEQNEKFSLIPGMEPITLTGVNENVWKAYTNHKLANKEDLLFLKSWFDVDTYFPDQIGKKVYKDIIYGDTTDTEQTDGGIGKIIPEGEVAPFGNMLKDSYENTNWFSYFLDKLKKEYIIHKEKGDPLNYINLITKRNIITETDFWKFFIGGTIDQAPEIGVRSIMTSLNSEYATTKDHPTTPFIEEKRMVVNRIKNFVSKTNSNYIGKN